MAPGSIRLNLVTLAQVIQDFAPGFVVRTELYVRLRRQLSSTPQRFVEPGPLGKHSGRGEFRGRKLVSPRTDLCIEGFPGSANTFVSNCLRDAVDGEANIESHFHQRVQLKRALAFGVPALVIVRAPRAACGSLKSKEPRYWEWLIILWWILYYRFVVRNRSKLELFRFEDLTRDVDLVRRRSEAVRRLVSRKIVARPEHIRASKQRRSLNEKAFFNRFLLKRANRVFDDLTSDGDSDSGRPRRV